MNIFCNYTGKRIGNIYIQSGENIFPFRTWEDFCVEIISDWIDVVNHNFQNLNFKLFFMDGPYYILCQREESYIKMYGVDDHDGSIIFTDDTSFQIIQTQLIKVAHMILNYHNQRFEIKPFMLPLQKELNILEHLLNTNKQ